MERAAHYGYFALKCGWTKEQVDAQPHWYIDRLPAFLAIVAEVEADAQKRASR